MEDRVFVLDKGLFNGIVSDRTLLPTLGNSNNLLNTVRDYREFYDPDSENWLNYVLVFFQLNGFYNENIYQRLVILKDSGPTSCSIALLGISYPSENFDQITSWLDWASFLSVNSIAYNVEWGIITNGLEIKIINFRKGNFESLFFWASVEDLIKNRREDSFFILSKTLHLLRSSINTSAINSQPRIPSNPTQVEISSLRQLRTSMNSDKFHRSSTINQARNRAITQKKSIISPPDPIPSVPPQLIRAVETHLIMANSHEDFLTACQMVAKKHNITLQTVKADCTQRIHLKAEVFSGYIYNKEKFISHLQRCYPKNKGDIIFLFTKNKLIVVS